MLDFYVKRRTRFFLRDKHLFEIIEVEIKRVAVLYKLLPFDCYLQDLRNSEVRFDKIKSDTHRKSHTSFSKSELLLCKKQI